MDNSDPSFVPKFIKIVPENVTATRLITLEDVFHAMVHRHQLSLSEYDLKRILEIDLKVNFQNTFPDYVKLFKNIFLLTWERWNPNAVKLANSNAFKKLQISLVKMLITVITDMEKYCAGDSEYDSNEPIIYQLIDIVDMILSSHA